MRVSRPHSIRSKLLASVALVGLLLAGVAAVVQSAFTSMLRNSNNTFEAGSITLSGSVDRSTALFDLEGVKPGPVASRCIKVTYNATGGLASTLKIHGSTTGPLAPYLRMKIMRGNFPGTPPPGGSCNGFTISSGIPLFEGNLTSLPAGWSTGILDTDVNWTDGESSVYRIDVELADN